MRSSAVASSFCHNIAWPENNKRMSVDKSSILKVVATSCKWIITFLK